MQRRTDGSMHDSNKDFWSMVKNQFLYTSGDKFFSDSWRNVISFQFADLSSVAPFQYHSVRSLGFMTYALCHIQNRMRCKNWEAVFEALMMYFKVKNADDAQRALKLNLMNKGFIDDSLKPLTAQERYQVNTALVELGLRDVAGLIEANSSSYTQNQNFSKDRVEKTRYQVMAEVNAMTSLISAGLAQAYQYQEFEDREVLRRFFIKDSRDPDVVNFQSCLKRAQVPDEYMVADAWESTHERVFGAGNQTLELTIAEWLMQNQQRFDPDSQRVILRKSTYAVTGDPGLSDQLVPMEPSTSNSVHDAQLAASGLLMGLTQALKQNVNHQEYADALMHEMALQIQKITQRNNVATPEELTGLQNLAGEMITGEPLPGNGIKDHIAILEKDEQNKEVVRKLSDSLGQLMNLVKGFAQRLQQQQQAQQKAQAQQQGGPDPKDMAKLQIQVETGKAKIQNMRESHAARTAQKQLSWEQQQQQREQDHALEMQKKAAELQIDLAKKRAMSSISE